MASQQQIKQRIGSVKNTRQITKAMELVSASKMRRAQEAVMRGRDYSRMAAKLLTRLRELTDVNKNELFALRPQPKARLHIVITSDRGLAGAYNSSVLRAFAQAVQNDRNHNLASYVITIGRQGSNFAGKLEYVQSLGAYTDFPDRPTANDLSPILDTALSAFIKGGRQPISDEEIAVLAEKADQKISADGKTDPSVGQPLPKAQELAEELVVPGVDYVDVIFTDYKSSIVQEVSTLCLLPAAFVEEPVDSDLELAVFEPSASAVLDSVAQRLVESQLYQALLESSASEQSSRMMAMKNASDNAGDIIDDLTLAFNTARQASITQELAEITGGAEAIS